MILACTGRRKPGRPHPQPNGQGPRDPRPRRGEDGSIRPQEDVGHDRRWHSHGETRVRRLIEQQATTSDGLVSSSNTSCSGTTVLLCLSLSKACAACMRSTLYRFRDRGIYAGSMRTHSSNDRLRQEVPIAYRECRTTAEHYSTPVEKITPQSAV